MSSDTICALPWHNINTTPMGQCKLCCNITDFKVLYAKTDRQVTGRKKRALGWGRDPLPDIWNGDHIRGVRRTMLEGGKPEDCGECYAMEARGATSPRQSANKDHLEQVMRDGLDEVTSVLPRSLELRLSTRCNLQCHTCWSGSSDKIAEERQVALASEIEMPGWLRKEWFNDISINVLAQQDFDSDKRYIESETSLGNFRMLAPNLERLYITGGEPTMDSSIYRYLQALNSVGNDSCHVSFTTNCTLWNEKLVSAMKHFPDNEVQLSIDGHGDTAAYVRHPTQWHEVCANVDRYMADHRVRNIRVFTVMSALNVAELEPMLRWLVDTSNRHGRETVWWPIMVSFPRHLRAHVLSKRARHAISDRLEALLDGSGWSEIHCHFREGLSELVRFLRGDGVDVPDDARQRLRTYLEFIDNVRGSDHRLALPNLDTDE